MKQKTGNAFVNAFAGLRYFFRYERNGRIQAILGMLSIAFAAFLNISLTEWIVILICVGGVLALEMFNSAMEKLCDLIQPGPDPRIKAIKDMTAGAVLWVSVISAVIAAIIFLPKILHYL
jgi:undecaprenol kinase/diacylglycerol kinase (ATP)